MPQILIIADDLTGAADSGAAFANAGWLTLVILDPTTQTPEGDVLVVSTESRPQEPSVRPGDQVTRPERSVPSVESPMEAGI